MSKHTQLKQNNQKAARFPVHGQVMKNTVQPMRSLRDKCGCHLTKINSDISQSSYTSSDVQHPPQFTDVQQIEDNAGTLAQNQNKDERAVSEEFYPADNFTHVKGLQFSSSLSKFP